MSATPEFQLFDTSILIPYFKGWAYARQVEQAIEDDRFWLSSVVLQELYAGTKTKADKQDLDQINRRFLALERIVTPLHGDWLTAGVVLARYRQLYGKIEPRDHINDLLILLGTARVGAELVTENAIDMQRWARILRKTGLKIKIAAVQR